MATLSKCGLCGRENRCIPAHWLRSKTRSQLTGASIQNRCIFLVIKPYFTPGAASTTVYNAFYWHSGATGVH